MDSTGSGCNSLSMGKGEGWFQSHQAAFYGLLTDGIVKEGAGATATDALSIANNWTCARRSFRRRDQLPACLSLSQTSWRMAHSNNARSAALGTCIVSRLCRHNSWEALFRDLEGFERRSRGSWGHWEQSVKSTFNEDTGASYTYS